MHGRQRQHDYYRQAIANRLRRSAPYAAAVAYEYSTKRVKQMVTDVFSQETMSGSQDEELPLDSEYLPQIYFSKMKSMKKKTYAPKKYRKMRVPRSIVVPEVKHYDVNQSFPFPVTASWSVNALGPAPTQGTDFINRVGRRIRVVGFELIMKFNITAPAQVPVYGGLVICDLWKDSLTRGGIATATDLYDFNVPNSLPNASNLKRFTRLHRMRHDIQVTSVSAGVTTGVNIVDVGETGKVSYRMLVNYISNVGTVADIMDNSFILTFCSTAPAVATAIGSSEISFRCRYIDA